MFVTLPRRAPALLPPFGACTIYALPRSVVVFGVSWFASAKVKNQVFGLCLAFVCAGWWGDVENALDSTDGAESPPYSGQKGFSSCYHVVSRINGRAFLFGDWRRRCSAICWGGWRAFAGWRCSTFALLDNHFHLLVRVPKEVGDLSDEALLDRVAASFTAMSASALPLSLHRIGLALRAEGEVRDRMRELLMARMASLPMFVKLLKQRFSIIYNREHDRLGDLVGGTATTACWLKIRRRRCGPWGLTSI